MQGGADGGMRGDRQVEWVFIGLVVVVVAAVAMVAVGRGDGLAPAVPDRPDVELPTDRPLDAADLDQLKLSVVVRGYRMDEVDALLARLGAEMQDRDAHGDTRRDAPRPVPPVPGATALSAGSHPGPVAESVSDPVSEPVPDPVADPVQERL